MSILRLGSNPLSNGLTDYDTLINTIYPYPYTCACTYIYKHIHTHTYNKYHTYAYTISYTRILRNSWLPYVGSI